MMSDDFMTVQLRGLKRVHNNDLIAYIRPNGNVEYYVELSDVEHRGAVEINMDNLMRLKEYCEGYV